MANLLKIIKNHTFASNIKSSDKNSVWILNLYLILSRPAINRKR